MAILIYDYCELEERAGKHLRVWKACHIVIFAFAAIFGILNYIFLRSTMSMVGENCVLIPPKIELKTVWIDVPYNQRQIRNTTGNNNETEAETSVAEVATVVPGANKTSNDEHLVTNTTGRSHETEALTLTTEPATEVPRANNTTGDHQTTDATGKSNDTKDVSNKAILASDVSAANKTVKLMEGRADNEKSTNRVEQHEVLDLDHTYFGTFRDCEFAEFAPLGATMCALLWVVLFLMCPGGGRSRTGLSQPWRILAPALLCSLVLVGITGHGFTQTNSGLRDFCAAFQNVTNATTCSSVNVYLESSWNTTWSFSSRAEATRAASAALWVCWAGAATLFIVRCLAAPDFQLRKTGVYLARDPAQKVTPYLRKARGRAGASPSPTKSARSEPTATTELVTATIEDSSITGSPVPEHVTSV